MRPRRALGALTPLATVALLSACIPETHTDPPMVRTIDHESAALTVEQNLRSNLGGMAAALAPLVDAWLGSGMGGVSSCTTPPEVEPGGDVGDDVGVDDGGCVSEPDLEAGAAELVDFIMEEVFTEERVESSTPSSVTYLLDAELLCPQVGEAPTPAPDGQDSPPAPEPATDEGCAQMLEQVPIRLRVTSPAEGDLDIEVLVGEAQLVPVALRVYRAELGARVDLAALRQALAMLAQAAGEGDMPLPQIMTGVIDVSLAQIADQRFRVTTAIPVAIDIADAELGVQVHLDAAEPASTVEIDGAGQRLVSSVAMGLIEVAMPLQAFGSNDVAVTCDIDGNCVEEEPTAELVGTIALHLAGLSATTTFSGASEQLAVNGLSLGNGPARLTLDGASLVELALNPSTGGLLDLLVNEAEGGARITVSPTLDLSVVLTLGALAEQVSEIPAWTLDETLRVVLDGADAPSILLRDLFVGDSTTDRETDPDVDVPDEPPPVVEPASLLQVLEGRLTLWASSLAEPVEVTAPQCLISAPDSGDEHPFSSLEAGVCQ